jgi:hypothetical protein
MLSVIGALYVRSANEPVQSRRWGAGVYSVNEPVSPWRDILRDWARTFNTEKPEAALFTRTRGHKKHLRPKLTGKMKVGIGFIRFKKQVTHLLPIRMDAHLTFKEHHSQFRKKDRAAETRRRTLTETDGVVPESVRAVQPACHTRWEQPLGGCQRCRQARRPPISPLLTIQNRPQPHGTH